MNAVQVEKVRLMAEGHRVVLTDADMDVLEAADVPVRTCFRKGTLGQLAVYVGWTDPAACPPDVEHKILGNGRMVAWGSL